MSDLDNFFPYDNLDAWLYDWAVLPDGKDGLFPALAKKLCEWADLPAEERNDKMEEAARAVFEKNNGSCSKIADEDYKSIGIDPFSFIYTLASRVDVINEEPTWEDCVKRIKTVFEIDRSPKDRIFPTSHGQNVLFHGGDKRIDDDEPYAETEPEALQSLWQTFKQVVEAKKATDIQALDAEIRRMLSIKQVGLLKLTSTLFLINPRCFLPLDKKRYSERTNGFIPIPEDDDIKQGNSTYSQACQEIQKLFDGCLPYEINRFLYLIHEKKIIITDNQPWLISSNADGHQKDKDYFDEDPDPDKNGKNPYMNFRHRSCVFTGNGLDDTRDTKCRLSCVRRGDVMIIRTGIDTVRAIGVVLHNGYEDGWEKEQIIRVAFLHVNTDKARSTAARFDESEFKIGYDNLKAVRQEYPDTFRLLDNIRKR